MSGRRWVGVALGAVLVGYAGLVLLSRTAYVRHTAERLASEATGYEVRIGRLGLDWTLDARAGGVRLAAPGREPFLTVERVTASGLPRAPLGDPAVEIVVQEPRFRLADWEPPPAAEPAAEDRPLSLPSWIRGIEVRDGFLEAGGPDRAVGLGPIDVTAGAVEAGSDLRLTGTSALPGRAGSLEWSARLSPGGRHLTATVRAASDRPAALLEELGLDLPDPSPLDGGSASIEATVEGAIGAPLAVAAEGRAVLGPEGPAYVLDGSGEIDLDADRSVLDLGVRAEEPERAVDLGAGALRFTDASLEVETTLAAAAPRIRLRLSGVGWTDAGGSLVVERARVGGELVVAPEAGAAAAPEAGEARSDASEARAAADPVAGEGDSLRFDLETDAGEVLVANRYYLDLAARPVSFAGAVRTIPSGVALREARIAVRGLGGAELSGSWTRPVAGPTEEAPPATWAADVELDLPDVAPAFALAVREPWAEAFPILDGMEVAGSIQARLSAEQPAAGLLSIGGRVRWQDGRLSVESPELSVARVDLDLPILFGTSRGSGGARGEAELAGFSIGGIEVGSVDLPLQAGRDRLALARPVSLDALGGEVVLTELAATDLGSESQALHLGLRLEDLRLAPIATAIGLPAFGGELDAALPRVNLAAGVLETEGEIVLEAFGGAIRLQHLRARDVGSGVATFLLDASFEEISLGALTEVFDLGEISGVARGAVEGLEVQAGTPVRFRAWMETVPRSGVPQRISVDAIRQLSILGGSGGDPFSSGLLSFFDEYRYAKIGFRASLEGDRLTLEGIERHEDKEYLVVGAFLPPRVDVVSHTQKIAFSEMLRRLARALESEGPRIE